MSTYYVPTVPLEYSAQSQAWQVCSRGETAKGYKIVTRGQDGLLPSQRRLVKMEDGQKHPCIQPEEELLVLLIESLL